MENEIFEVKLPTGETLKGRNWKAKEATASLVIATGMQEHALRYEGFARFLNEQGYDVYVLDAFGQGLNVDDGHPVQVWPEDGFRKNVDGIALTLKLAGSNGKPAYVMGHSMGSFMVQSLLEEHPGLAKKAILCGSNGGQLGLMKLASLLAHILVHKGNMEKPVKLLTKLSLDVYADAVAPCKTSADWLSYNEDNVKAYLEDPLCGNPNTGSFWLGFLDGMKRIWEKKSLGKIDKSTEVLIISGKQDPVGQFGSGLVWLYDTYRRLGLSKVVLHLYPNMRHEVLNEDGKAEVYRDVVSFLE